MKTVKTLLMLTMLGVFTISANSCAECKNESPRAKITNNGTATASVQIKTSGGNTVNINNVDPGTSSAYSGYAAGITTFTISVSNLDYVEVVVMSDCYEYDIAIDANNTITTTATDRND